MEPPAPRPALRLGAEQRIVDVTVKGGSPVGMTGDAPPAGMPSTGPPTGMTGTVLPAGATRAPEPVAGPTAVTYAATRRSERAVMVLSTILGTLGILIAGASAVLDQVRYDQPGPCASFAASHPGSRAFGCSSSAKHLAVALPLIGIPLLVLAGLAAVWVPQRPPSVRAAWLAVLFLALVVAAVCVALAYSALPKA